MNQRIKELLDKATYDVLGVKQVDQKQFAELIVRECAEVCIGKYYYSDQMSKQCGINFAKDIKQHFGVEE